MSLVEKLSKIQLEQEQVKKQFMNEVYQGLQQIDAMKTKEEVEAQRKYDLETTTPTDITTTRTDLGEERISKNIRGEAIKTETVVDTTTKPTEKDVRREGKYFVTYRDGKEVAKSLISQATDKNGKELTPTQGKRVTKYVNQIDKSKSLILGIEGQLDNFNSIIEEAETIASEEGEELKGKKKVQILVDGEFIDIKVSDLRRRIKIAEASLKRENENIKKFNDKIDEMGLVGTKENDTDQRKEGESIEDYLKRTNKWIIKN